MGSFLSILIDTTILAIIVYSQWQLGRAFSSYAARRFRSTWNCWLRWLPIALGAALLFGFLLSYSPVSEIVPDFRMRRSTPLRMAAALWAFAATGAYLVYRICRLFAPQVAGFDASRRKLVQAAGSAVVAAPFAVLAYGALVERTAFRVREIAIPVSHLPPDLEGLRLLQLSDIHLSPFLSESELARVIDTSNELRPHVALITGDLISTRGDPLDACLRQLARLRVDSEVLGCLGNHEIYADAERETAARGARLGIRFLRNQARPLRFGSSLLNFVGVDYQRLALRPRYLEGAERLVAPGALNVLLSHNPDVFPEAVEKGYDLLVAGHTHGGQVTVEILHQTLNMARFFTPFVYGLYHLQRGGHTASAYVTRGVGTIGVPARIGAPPEIALMRLTRA